MKKNFFAKHVICIYFKIYEVLYHLSYGFFLIKNHRGWRYFDIDFFFSFWYTSKMSSSIEKLVTWHHAIDGEVSRYNLHLLRTVLGPPDKV